MAFAKLIAFDRPLSGVSAPGFKGQMCSEAEIVRLVNDDALRIRLALEGNRWIQRFTWVRAGTQLEELITNVRLHERVGL